MLPHCMQAYYICTTKLTYNKMQRTKYYVLPSHNGWEGMMEGAIRASVVANDKDEVLERQLSLPKKGAKCCDCSK